MNHNTKPAAIFAGWRGLALQSAILAVCAGGFYFVEHATIAAIVFLSGSMLIAALVIYHYRSPGLNRRS